MEFLKRFMFMESGDGKLLEININEISEKDFLRKKDSIPVLFSSDKQPRSYYLLSIDDKQQWLIDQVDVGLKSIPYMICSESNLLFVATTFNLYVIDYINNKIDLEYVLQTPCVDFFTKDEIVYVICETELVHFSLKYNRIVKCDKFSYMLEDLIITKDCVVITLENGEIVTVR